MLKETLNKSYPEMFELYDKVIDWEYVRNKEVYEQVNAEFIPYEENEELHRLQKLLFGRAEMICRILQSLWGSILITVPERKFLLHWRR